MLHKLFLGVLTISTCYIHSADKTERQIPDGAIAKPYAILVPSMVVFFRVADKDESVRAVKSFYVKRDKAVANEIRIIKRGCNIPHDTRVQGGEVVKTITESYQSIVNGTVPRNAVVPTQGVDLTKDCPATLEVFKRGIDLSQANDVVLEKGTEYVVFFPAMYRVS